MGYGKNLISMQGLGYKEIISYLDGECSLEDAIDRLKQNTRHFAKRQLTWFRNEERVHWIDLDSFSRNDDVVKNIAAYVAGIFK
jgi:tRNA dimethylallyltransferase